MTRPDWAPAEIDLDRPNVARMYDYYLGGSHNLGVDREVADQVIATMPELPRIVHANRSFLRRAVTCCLAAGVRQFLDIGSGIPTVGNVHEIAQRADPAARVVYVDTDAVAIAHARAILAGNGLATAIQEDVRRPEAILDHPEVDRVLDLDQPVAVLLVALLHFIPDSDDPAGLVRRLMAPVPPGSHLVISHGLTATERGPGGDAFLSLYRQTRNPITPRTREEIERLFAGLELLDPGVAWLPEWRPDGEQADGGDGSGAWTWMLAGVAGKL